MPEIDKLIEEIIRQKPDVDKKKIWTLIAEKKKTIGDGYLTDSGAVYLVASDLDVIINVDDVSELPIKDVYIGATDITVVGRVFTVPPTKTYNKKDGTEGKYRRLTIFDKDAFIIVTLWDDHTNLIEERDLKQNQLVRIMKGYVKSGLDNKPIIHIGTNGDLENVDSKDTSYKIPFIDDIIQDISSVNTAETNLALTGMINSPPRISEFTKKDGKPGKVLSLYITNISGGRSVRIAIWNNDLISDMDIPRNSIVKLIGLKSRPSKEGDLEIHGDEGTSLEILSVQKSFGESRLGTFRLLSFGKIRVKEDGNSSASLLIVDKSKSFFTLILKDEATEVFPDLKIDTIIECEFSEISPFTYLCDNKSSFKIIDKEDSSFPKLNSIICKIDELTDSKSPRMLEVMSLSKASVQDIVTKTGETVVKIEVLVGDETKEIKLVAWRDLSDILSDISPGQRLKLLGVVSSKALGGVIEILVKSYTYIETKS